MNGGERVAAVLERQGVKFLFTLCGGHISPILVGCKARGIRVIDVRDEANAVFAADAVGRLTGVPGVAAVTAGPGVTNTLTALKNAQMAQSPLVLLGGGAATVLKGRGSLQDIDQLSVIEPHVKWSQSVQRVADIVPALEEAFRRSLAGVPGPVFLELPIDLLYDEELIRGWYMDTSGTKGAKSLAGKATALYLRRHLNQQFAGPATPALGPAASQPSSEPLALLVKRAAAMLARAERPAIVVGSQALVQASQAPQVAEALNRLGAPVWLAGMARGLLGHEHPLHMRHKRTAALKEADLVILAGVPCDFRMGYGRSIGRKAKVISANLNKRTLLKNRIPQLPVPGDPGRFLCLLAEASSEGAGRWGAWKEAVAARDQARDEEIVAMASQEAPPLNPIEVCRGIERHLADDSALVVDGGDFVATAAYTVRPRRPLRWLDPGVFGTLGVGAGFALAAALCYPEAEVWLIYGDGAAGFSLIELDTFARHGLGVIAVVGNDAGWTQIARDQVVFLKDDVGTVLSRTAYHTVAEGLGGAGFLVDDASQLDRVLAEAKTIAAQGRPVLINAHIGKTDFRKGSISM
jgi:acetolactate synthase-1/2/3 large subunit